MNGDPNDDPKEGVWLVPKPPGVAELKTNGEGAAAGARIKMRKNIRSLHINHSTKYDLCL